MRKHDQPKTNLFIAAGAGIFLSLALLSGAAPNAVPAVANEHLPEKAKSVAAKFEIFKQTATPGELELKRKQVIDYLGSLLKQEAADADLEGALAVRDLIGTIQQDGSGATKTSSVSAKSPGPEGLALTRFSLGQKRRLEFPFTVSRDPRLANLRCEIVGASDDSGDKGLHYELIDPSGKVTRKGFLQSMESDLVSLKTRIAGTWKLAVIDKDTSLDGEFPGNNGTVQIRVTRDESTIASRR